MSQLRICACLSWYAEPIPALERCVGSLAGVCDQLVYLPARWEPFPEVPGDDRAGQIRAVTAAARAAGITAVRVGRQRTFGSQVAARDALMRAAAGHGDWLLVIDADEWIDSCDRGRLERALAAAAADAGQALFLNYPRLPHRFPRRILRLYRAAAGVGVEIAHNGYRAADGRWLQGNSAYVQVEQPFDVSDCLTIGHDVDGRANGPRSQARREFTHRRIKEHLEDWLPTWKQERAARKEAVRA